MDADESANLQARGQRRLAVAGGFAFILAVAVAMVGLARNNARVAYFEASRSAMLEQLHNLAYQDSLTGLPRKVLTEDRLHVAVAQAKREGRSVGVLFIDLDGFKALNDLYGHAAGDAMLQMIAGKMRACLRDGDTVGRIGGDEFLVVLPYCDDAEALAQIGARFVEAAQQATLPWEGQQLSVGASVGGALYPQHGIDAASVTSAADQAMYLAKKSGGGYRMRD